MQKIPLAEAESCLAELVKEATNGEEIIITQTDGSAVKLVALSHDKPTPKYGSAKGLIQVSDDFDEPLDDFQDYSPLSNDQPRKSRLARLTSRLSSTATNLTAFSEPPLKMPPSAILISPYYAPTSYSYGRLLESPTSRH